MDVKNWVFWLGSAWLMADFLTGVVHWIEDRYGNPDWPVLGKYVIQPNIRHHKDQRAFLEGSYLKRNWTTMLPTLSLAVLFYALGQPWLSLVAVFSSQANEVHGWAHQKCNRVIRALQLLGVFSSPEDHATHHNKPFSTDFCVMSAVLNPVLELFLFWPTLETVLGRLTGIWPRIEREQA
jgi:ubiquitin-conjugating enzyme E2 variant